MSDANTKSAVRRKQVTKMKYVGAHSFECKVEKINRKSNNILRSYSALSVKIIYNMVIVIYCRLVLLVVLALENLLCYQLF